MEEMRYLRHEKQRTSFVAQARSRAASASQALLPVFSPSSKDPQRGGIHPMWPAGDADGRMTL